MVSWSVRTEQSNVSLAFVDFVWVAFFSLSRADFQCSLLLLLQYFDRSRYAKCGLGRCPGSIGIAGCFGHVARSFFGNNQFLLGKFARGSVVQSAGIADTPNGQDNDRRPAKSETMENNASERKRG